MTLNENTNQSEIDAMLAEFRQAQERTRTEEERLFAKLQEAIARTEAEEKAMREKFLAEVATAQTEEEQFISILGLKNPNKKTIRLDTLIPNSIYYSNFETKGRYSFETRRPLNEQISDMLDLLRKEDRTQTEQALAEAIKYAVRGDEYCMQFALMTARMYARDAGLDIRDRITAIERDYKRRSEIIPRDELFGRDKFRIIPAKITNLPGYKRILDEEF